MSRNFVIGGGISGYVFAFYHNDYFIIDDSEPKYDNPFIFIQENDYSKNLLDDLHISSDVIPVAIIADNSDNVIMNKLGAVKRKYLGTDKIANIGKNNELFVFDTTERVICEKIKERISERIIKGRAVKITRDKISVKLQDTGAILEFKYNRIVSTIHFEDFAKIMPSWHPGNKYTVSSLFYDIKDADISSSSITYTNDNRSKIVENSVQKKIAIEYREGSADVKELKRARVAGVINPPPEKVTFLGRFASGNPHWRIEDSIYIAQKGLEILDILDEQRRFDEAVKNKTECSMDLRMQSLILGAHSELSELLEEIPYGLHKNPAKAKTVDSKNILMESIDVIKYMLAIMHEFNFTPREIYEMFFTKSNFLWDRFINDFYGGV